MPGLVGAEDLENPQYLLDESIIDRSEAVKVVKKRKLSVLQKQHLDELNEEVKGEKLSFESNVSDKKFVTDTGDVEVDHLQEGKDQKAILKSSMARKQRGLYEAI